ncbi:hypothetical protein IT398_00735 [Candidatus Nomurabacteria bacterium]|nr:hypothetical protein [Candidatus Nomurabacteria bacterium]
MAVQKILSVISGLLFLVAFVPYIRAILSGETKPAKTSWLIWATLDTITLTAMFVADTVNGQIVGAVLGSWIVAGLAMKYGSPGWTRIDVFCLVGSGIGIGLWWMFSNPTLGIVVSVSVVFLAAIPTFHSAWEDPSRENRTAWIIYWLSCVAAVLAIPAWTLADVAQPIVFLTIESVMMYILFFSPGAKILRMLAED